MSEAYKALAKAQAEMRRAEKGGNNPHFRSKYADLGNVQDACMDALRANGFAVFQPTGHDELGMFVKTVLAHQSGETLEARTPLLVGKNDMQGLGSAITYARRYGLLCMSGVAPEDDDANQSVQQRHAKPVEMPPDVLSKWNSSLEAVTTLEGLRIVFTEITSLYGNNTPPELIATKDTMKARLEEERNTV